MYTKIQSILKLIDIGIWICIQKIIRLVLFQCEPSDYEEVVNLLFEVLYTAEITKERLLVFIQRLLNDVAQV